MTKRTMSFRIKLDTLTPEVLAALFSPAALLALKFRELYGRHWYLGGIE
ncbi:hypothetical protein I5G67_gp063 [Mycobacterium phage Aminay]|uniref:Uncharacterized protein n=1 Tax=Mycobacterium phage Aminay TaxID=2250291 RepID=A0A345KV48_9CAUD|nr:hypothetical protein I5G67_gp063 [Mycobacterium phage Aminay]AXH46900.1 hypothetical protein SEA_AMINAY_63 [Mycobacterium phage Aminay]